MFEIEQLTEEIERSDNRYKLATQELEYLRGQIADKEEDGSLHKTRSRAVSEFSDMATEAEVRWNFFATEKARLQSEKGWRKALKESKKLLLDQLDESANQTKARDRELALLRGRISGTVEEEAKRKKEADALRTKINQLQEALDSEREFRFQEQEAKATLEEEFSALFHSQETQKMASGSGRSKNRLITHDLASQLSFNNEDFEEYDNQHRMSTGSCKLDMVQEEEVSTPHTPCHSESLGHFSLERKSLRPMSSKEKCDSVRKSIFLQREDDLHRRLHTSEAERCTLEAQVVELQRKLQVLEHASPATHSPPAEDLELHSRLDASEAARGALEAQVADLQGQLQRMKHKSHSIVSSQVVPEPEFSGASNELWEECEKLRNDLNTATQEEQNAKWEAKDKQRRLCASEAQRRQLESQISEMQRQAQLAEKELRALQQSEREPWWSRFKCHCLHKRSDTELPPQPLSSTAMPDTEEQQVRPPRAAIHMKAANHSGASWLSKPMG